ncbi:GNAT family N-acetyltransferase [Halobacillus shinanisalinarum]|uniref:GNAT family N-acetyltransferase n=1 Tax=Halobacillus shinanisalinarum TaxID=2932258 RepID=A0ABY4H4C8_9BACI|nr:GNAT family N-acetyltransferase [Halobacillus shinanisalinarum]UOQ95323.1 GNAT family N-acetyltransferase [Halobacillus shinanisalinarum]
MEDSIKLTTIRKRNNYLPYILLADETEDIIKEYINEGEMFSIEYNGRIVGVCLFIFPSLLSVELKNFAIDSDYQGKGLGKLVVKKAFKLYKDKGLHDMVVGTANSSIANLAFYQKAGFRIDDIYKDFFARYPEPIYEDGIQALDMIRFRKKLT